MTRIALTQVAYDARRACFHARAVLDDRAPVDCRWHGPQGAAFSRSCKVGAPASTPESRSRSKSPWC